MSFKI